MRQGILEEKFSLRAHPFDPEGNNIYTEPLNPLKRPDDVDLFEWVDNIREQLDEYLKYLEPLENPTGCYPRHVVLLRGDRGCGKTSLARLCIHHFCQECFNGEPIIVTLPESIFIANTTSKIMNKAARELRKELSRIQRTVCPDLVALKPSSSEDDVRDVIDITVEWFEEEDIACPVLFFFEGIKREQELWELCNAFYKLNWVIFFTTEERPVLQKVQSSRREENFEYITLEIEKIDGDHAAKFIRSRLQKARTGNYCDDEFFPFEKDAIFQIFSDECYPLRYWTKMCHKTLQEKIIQLEQNACATPHIDYEFMKSAFNERGREI